MSKPLSIGTKLRTIEVIYNPLTQKEYPVGTHATIVSVGADAQFGWYVIEIDNHTMLWDIKKFVVDKE